MAPRKNSPAELLDGIIGFLAAFAVGFVIIIGISIVRGTHTPGPSLVLGGILLALWLLWTKRQSLHRTARRHDTEP